MCNNLKSTWHLKCHPKGNCWIFHMDEHKCEFILYSLWIMFYNNCQHVSLILFFNAGYYKYSREQIVCITQAEQMTVFLSAEHSSAFPLTCDDMLSWVCHLLCGRFYLSSVFRSVLNDCCHTLFLFSLNTEQISIIISSCFPMVADYWQTLQMCGVLFLSW